MGSQGGLPRGSQGALWADWPWAMGRWALWADWPFGPGPMGPGPWAQGPATNIIGGVEGPKGFLGIFQGSLGVPGDPQGSPGAGVIQGHPGESMGAHGDRYFQKKRFGKQIMLTCVLDLNHN